MTAPFPLSSSAGYAFMAQHNGWTIVPYQNAQPGDILVHDTYNDAFNSTGPRGHTEVLFEKSSSGLWLSGGSAGGTDGVRHHRGVDEHWRKPGFWCFALRVPGMSGARLARMRDWINRFAWVTYYAGDGNNDHDGYPDRADCDDGNGIDCSGAVFLLFEDAWSIPASNDPPLWTKEQLEALIKIMEELDVEHGQAVDAVVKPGTGKLGIPPVGYKLERWGGVVAFGGAVPVKTTGYWPGQDVARRVVVTDWTVGLGYVMDLGGGMHPFGPASDLSLKAPKADGAGYWKPKTISAFNEVG